MNEISLKSIGVVCASFIALSACTISMSDDAIFRPPEWSQVAESKEDLRFKDQSRLLESSSDLFENRDVAEHLPAQIQHGFLSAGSYKIAYSVIRSGKASENSERPLIVSCYGSGGDRPNLGVYYTEKLLPWGDVLQFDYPGYGDSSGSPSIEAVQAIAPEVVKLANEQAGAQPLVFWGHSLGGFICPRLAELSPKLDGFVYEASALNAEEAAKEWKPWFLRMVPFVKLEPTESTREGDNASPLKDKNIPVLVLAGGKDKVLPAWLSRSLTSALEAQGNDVTYLEFEKGTHVNIPNLESFDERVAPFFKKIALTETKPFEIPEDVVQ